MKNQFLTLGLLAFSVMTSSHTLAEGSVQHFSQSATHTAQSAQHSAGSVGNAFIGTSKAVSGVAAIPFKAIEGMSTVSGTVGDMLWDNATGDAPLELTDDTITAGPTPFVALNN